MKPVEVDTYLARLAFELEKRGLPGARILEEAEGHLVDAIDRGVQQGLAPDAAAADAVGRFGDPEAVAMNFAAERYRLRDRLLVLAATAFGLGIAYIDSRPGWDDAGITAFTMLVLAGVFGLIAPRSPWLWALAIGVWIPLYAIVRAPSSGSVAMLAVLAFPIAGAYAGMAARRAVGALNRPAGSSGFHDRSARGFRFLVKSKRGWVNPELLAIASNPDTDLVPFLQQVAPGPLGPLGVVQSVTMVEDASGAAKPTRTYRAVFGADPAIVCTVVLASDGTSVAVHWARGSSTASSTPDLSARR